jgi:hypothetical protein
MKPISRRDALELLRINLDKAEDNDKPILCLDFDGVCHSYSTGWQGAINIPDPPVDGLRDFLLRAMISFKVMVYSTRSNYPGGREAMISWFIKHGMADLVDTITFPDRKPPAKVTLDDHALTFTGEWPEIDTLLRFEPWHKGGA